MAALAMLIGINLAGCGGGGGGDDDDDAPNNPQNPNGAPEQIGGNNIVFYSGAAGTRAIAFEDSTSWTENREGTTATGSYLYRRVGDGSSAEITLNEEGHERTIVMSFNSANSGSFVYADQSLDGTFEMQAITPDPGGGNEPPGNDGLAPGSLAGRTMYGTRTFTTTGPVGQTHVYTFSMSTFHDSDPPEESDGIYVYQPSGNEANLTLNYQSPEFFNGDAHGLQMTFHTETAGVFESVYTRRDGTVIRINGTFRLE